MSTERDLAKLLGRIEKRLTALEQGARTSQLQHASITGSAITVYDEDGETRRGSIGMQPDGTIGFVAVDGPAPTAPSAPTVAPSLAGLRVVWDGTFADGSETPADFAHVAVHVSTVDGFTPSPETFAGTITRAGEGGMLPVTPLPYALHYVRLSGVNTSGVGGAPSTQASGTPVKVDGPDLKAGSVTAGAIAAGAVKADKLEAVLTLVNRIVAGDPSGARVELNSAGLRVYNGSGALVVQFDAATGDAVFSGDITGADISGSTVTGGVVQTGTSGRRVVLTPNGDGGADGTVPATRYYTADPAEGAPAQIYATLRDRLGNVAPPTLALRSPVTTEVDDYRTFLDLRTNMPGTSKDSTFVLAAASPDGMGGAAAIEGNATDGTGAVVSQIALSAYDPAADEYGQLTITPNKLEMSPDIGLPLNYENGVLHTGNIAYGTATITPSAANTPTSHTVGSLFLNGTTFRAYVTASTTVPGANPSGGAVLGVGATNASSTGCTLWVTRTNLTATVVNWMIVGV